MPKVTNGGFEISTPQTLHEGYDVAVFATGRMVEPALNAARNIQGKVSIKVINVSTIKPMDGKKIITALGDCRAVLTVEEHSTIGGLGCAVASAIRHKCLPMEFLGIKDTFGRSGRNYEEVMSYFGLTSEAIASAALEIKQSRRKSLFGKKQR